MVVEESLGTRLPKLRTVLGEGGQEVRWAVAKEVSAVCLGAGLIDDELELWSKAVNSGDDAPEHLGVLADLDKNVRRELVG